MKTKYFTPLLFFIIPTAIISPLMWPTEAMKFYLVGGFVVMILSMIVTYFMGIRVVLRDKTNLRTKQVDDIPDCSDKSS
jgi:hypothetical protein